MKPPSARRILPIAAAALTLASVAAGLLVLHPPFPPSPESGRWRLDFHDSLAGFADHGRLANCAWAVTGDVTASPEDAIASLTASGDDAVSERGCAWYDMFQEYRIPGIQWRRIDAHTVELCGEIKPGRGGATEVPRAHHFTFREIGETPVQAGPHCYTIDVSAAPTYRAPDPPSPLPRAYPPH